jgi:hypothetical protein
MNVCVPPVDSATVLVPERFGPETANTWVLALLASVS